VTKLLLPFDPGADRKWYERPLFRREFYPAALN